MPGAQKRRRKVLDDRLTPFVDLFNEISVLHAFRMFTLKVTALAYPVDKLLLALKTRTTSTVEQLCVLCKIGLVQLKYVTRDTLQATDKSSRDVFELSTDDHSPELDSWELCLSIEFDVKNVSKKPSAIASMKLVEDMRSSFMLKACEIKDLDDEWFTDAHTAFMPAHPNGPKQPLLTADKNMQKVSVEDSVEQLKQVEWYDNQIVHAESIAARIPSYGQMDLALFPTILWAALKRLYNVTPETIYQHQVEAIESCAINSQTTVISTSTSSGKSLIYNATVVRVLLDPHNADMTCAMYIFPTVII